MSDRRQHRIVLEKLIERLEPIVGKVSPADFAYWEDEHDLDAVRQQRSDNGWYQLAEALQEAREALASNDPERIALAATLACPPLERNGLERARKYAETAKRRAGGKRTGAMQREAAIARMKPYTERYSKLVSTGTPYLKARQTVIGQMVKDGVPVPSQPRLNVWFPKPKNKPS